MIKAILFDLGDTIVKEEGVADEKLMNTKLEKVPYVEEVLRQLKGKYKLAVVTNTSTSRENRIRLALRIMGLEDYFDAVVTSVDIGHEKPDEEIYCEALKRIRVKPTEAVMVGNRIKTDVLGANKLGIISVHLKWNDRYPEEADSPLEEPDYTINSLREFPRILPDLEKNKKGMGSDLSASKCQQ
jgi:putative hydrolase of the HAD superfamily